MNPAALDLGAYLERVRCSRPARPDLEALAALQQAHQAEIPFENLDILLGRPIRLDLESLQAKLVRGRRGGYCFEQNTLLSAVLEALGFDVSPLLARVRMGAQEGQQRPRTHMLLLVTLPSGRFVADVGFGGDGPLRPLPFEDGAEVEIEGARHRLRREADEWVVASDAGDLYAFTLERQYPVDFVVANHYTSTWPRSPFVTGLTAQRSWPAERAVLRDRELVLRRGRIEEKAAVRDPEHLLELLAAHFGLSFPAGTRFSRPEF